MGPGHFLIFLSEFAAELVLVEHFSVWKELETKRLICVLTWFAVKLLANRLMLALARPKIGGLQEKLKIRGKRS